MAGLRSDHGQLAVATALLVVTVFAAVTALRDDATPGVLAQQAVAAVEPPAIDAAPKQPAPQPVIRGAELATADDGELIVDEGLRHAFDMFLVERTDSGRSAGLRQYLQGRLTGLAYRQAEQLAAAYQVYVKLYDEHLAAQNLSTRGVPVASVDLRRIASWARQRQRLRQQVFGADVARQWFENDDARLEAAIDQLQQGAELPPARPDPRYAPSPELLMREQAQHALYLKQVLDDATTSFRERSRG